MEEDPHFDQAEASKDDWEACQARFGGHRMGKRDTSQTGYHQSGAWQNSLPRVGAKLVQLLLRTATIVNEENQAGGDLMADAENLIKPAFYHEFQTRRGKRRGIIRVSEAVVQIGKSDPGGT